MEAVKTAAIHSLTDLATEVLPNSSNKKEFSVEVHDEQGHKVLKAAIVFDMEVLGEHPKVTDLIR